MKYGNFVGKEFLPFTEKETDAVVSVLKPQLEAALGKEYFSSVETEIAKGNFLEVKFNFKEPFNGRNLYNETVRNADRVTFVVTKQRGYLEVRKPKYGIDGLVIDPLVPTGEMDYDNAPDFQYGCSMLLSGEARGYRCRQWEKIQHWGPYTYGTEASDLTYREHDLKNIKSTLTRKH